VLEELKNVKTLIIDLSNFKENRGRSLDFISGAIFALDGELKKIDDNKFYCNLNMGEE
jgi:cell division inhibitor SepF